jgi:hypothetical protein
MNYKWTIGLGWVECIIVSQWKSEANAHRLNLLGVGMEFFIISAVINLLIVDIEIKIN